MDRFPNLAAKVRFFSNCLMQTSIVKVIGDKYKFQLTLLNTNTEKDGVKVPIPNLHFLIIRLLLGDPVSM